MNSARILFNYYKKFWLKLVCLVTSVLFLFNYFVCDVTTDHVVVTRVLSVERSFHGNPGLLPALVPHNRPDVRLVGASGGKMLRLLRP